MMRKDYFIDGHILNRLFESNRSGREFRRALKMRRSCGVLRIIVTTDVLEELAGWHGKDSQTYEEAMEFLFEVCAANIWWPIALLVRREVEKRSGLSWAECVLPAHLVEKSKIVMRDPAELAIIAKKVREQGDAEAERFQVAGLRVEELASQKMAREQRNQQVRSLRVNKPYVINWFEWLIEGGAFNVGSQIRRPNLKQMPLTRTYVCSFVALLKVHHQEGRSFRKSDFHDIWHLTAAGCGATLVTDDGKLTEIARSIEWHPPRVLGFDEWKTEVLSL